MNTSPYAWTWQPVFYDPAWWINYTFVSMRRAALYQDAKLLVEASRLFGKEKRKHHHHRDVVSS